MCQNRSRLPPHNTYDIDGLSCGTCVTRGRYVGGCGITTWQTNSQVVRYSAISPKGPWTRQNVITHPQSTCPSAALAPNGTVVLWTMGTGGGAHPKLGVDAWGKACVAGASPCGFAKHGCGPGAPPPLHPPPPPPSPSPGPKGGCASWANVSDYNCAVHSCLSDDGTAAGRCGDGLCYSAGPPPVHANSSLCAPLSCATYRDCSLVAASRCNADPRCHGFALYGPPLHNGRAQLFASGSSGLVSVGGWTAFTKRRMM